MLLIIFDLAHSDLQTVARYRLAVCTALIQVLKLCSSSDIGLVTQTGAITGFDNHMVRHPRCVFINYNWIKSTVEHNNLVVRYVLFIT